MKFKTKIFLVIIVFGFLLGSVIFLLLDKINTDSHIVQKLSNLSEIAKSVSLNINNSLEDSVSIAKTLSTSSIIKKGLEESIYAFSNLTEEDRKNEIEELNNKWMSIENEDDPFIQNYLDNEVADFLKLQQEILPGYYGEIFLTNKYGALVASTSKLTTLAHGHKYWWLGAYDEGNGKVFFDDRGFDPSANGYVVGIVLPIKNNDEIIGILKCNVNIEKLIYESLINYNDPQISEKIQIIRSGGLIIGEIGIQPLAEIINAEIIDALSKNKSLSEIIRINEKDFLVSSFPVKITESSEDHIFGGSYESIDHSKGNTGEIWEVIVSESRESALSGHITESNLFIFCGVVFVIISALIVFIISSFMMKPIKNLVNATTEFGKGNFNQKIEVKTKDEIGELGKAFNQMVKNINNVTASKKDLQREVSERKKVEFNLRKSREQLKQIVENSSNLFYSHDTNHQITYISPQVNEILGYTVEEAKIKWTDFSSEHPVNKTGLIFTEAAINTGKSQPPYELELVHKDGHKVWVEVREKPVIKDGKVISMVGSLTDITQRKKVQDELKESNMKFIEFMDHFPGVAFIKDSELRYIYLNKYHLENIGEKNWLGKKLNDFYDKSIVDKLSQVDESAVSHGLAESIDEIKFKNGETRNFHTYLFRIDRPGKPSLLGGVGIDITSEIKFQKEKDNSLKEIKDNFYSFMDTLSKVVEYRDPYTSGHQERVADLSVAIANRMGLDEERVEAIRIAALLHDIGKIYIPTEILNKAGKLSEVEFSMIKEHSMNGYNLLQKMNFKLPVKEFILQHHERINGSGYPKGLKEKEIYLESKIIAVADVVEAISSYRPYRAALGIEAALKEIENNSGKLYDPEVVKACFEIFEEGYEFTEINSL